MVTIGDEQLQLELLEVAAGIRSWLERRGDGEQSVDATEVA